MKKKACKNDKMFVEGDECPVCKGNNFVTMWKGRIHLLDASKSGIAKKIGLTQNGEYALKVS